MKIKVVLLSLMLVSALFVINGFSVDWDNPGTQTIDQMLSGSQYGANNTQPGSYVSPSASRSAQSSQKGKEILNVPLGGKLNTIGYNPKETRVNDQAQPGQTTNTNASTTTPMPVAASTTTASASAFGSWSLNLTDSATHSATITLFQSGDVIYGTGNLALDANKTLMAAASGMLLGNELSLDLVTLGKVNLYRLEMSIGADSSEAEGNYTAYSPNGSPYTGTVRGTRSAF
jgi:hypothetical protein